MYLLEGSKKDKKKGAAAPAPAPASAVPAGAEDVVAKIVAKGDEIRALKAKDKRDPKIMELVEELKALKDEYKTVTGTSYIAPNTQGTASQVILNGLLSQFIIHFIFSFFHLV